MLITRILKPEEFTAATLTELFRENIRNSPNCPPAFDSIQYALDECVRRGILAVDHINQ